MPNVIEFASFDRFATAIALGVVCASGAVDIVHGAAGWEVEVSVHNFRTSGEARFE